MLRLSSAKLTISRLAANATQSTVLKIVRDYAPISRSGIVDRCGQPLSAVSRTVSRLRQDQILLETPLADSNGPRRKRGLSLNPAAGHCLSVQYGPSGLEGAVLDAAYNVIARTAHKAPLEAAPRQKKLNVIIAFIDSLRSEAPASAGQCLALAVVDPGVVDERTGTVLMSSTMDDWSDVPIVDILQERFSLPVMLTNTSLATIRAVDRMELKGLASNLIHIEYDEGVGCGLKLQGIYITGQSNLGGEFGHLRVTDQPVPCRCGAVGCLEAVAALPALRRNAAQALGEGAGSTLSGRENLDGRDVLAAAGEGDRLACRVVNEAFGYLGRAVGGLVNTLAPQVVVFDSAIATAGTEAVAALMQSVKSSTLPSHLHNLDLRISRMTSHIGCLGGAAAVLDYCLEC